MAATAQRHSMTPNLYVTALRHAGLPGTSTHQPNLWPWNLAGAPWKPTHPCQPAYSLHGLWMEGLGLSRPQHHRVPGHQHAPICSSKQRKGLLPLEPELFPCRWKATACSSYAWCLHRPHLEVVSTNPWPWRSEHNHGAIRSLCFHHWRIETLVLRKAGLGTSWEKLWPEPFSAHTLLDGSRPRRGTSSPWVWTILSICEEITQTLGPGAEVRMDTVVRYIYLNIDN